MSSALSSLEVGVWWARPAHARPAYHEWLTSDERERAAAYRRPVDTDRFVVGCALSRAVLGRLAGVPPGEVRLRRDCNECGKPHGRPRLHGDEWFVSVSHAGEWIAVAVTGLGPVGVDVEEIGRVNAGVAEAMLTPAELASHATDPAGLTRLWTRKEAAVKSTGDGIGAGLREVKVSRPDRPAKLLDYPGRPGLRMWMSDLDVDTAHTAAIAVQTTATATASRHDGGAVLRSATV